MTSQVMSNKKRSRTYKQMVAVLAMAMVALTVSSLNSPASGAARHQPSGAHPNSYSRAFSIGSLDVPLAAASSSTGSSYPTGTTTSSTSTSSSTSSSSSSSSGSSGSSSSSSGTASQPIGPQPSTEGNDDAGGDIDCDSGSCGGSSNGDAGNIDTTTGRTTYYPGESDNGGTGGNPHDGGGNECKGPACSPDGGDRPAQTGGDTTCSEPPCGSNTSGTLIDGNYKGRVNSGPIRGTVIAHVQNGVLTEMTVNLTVDAGSVALGGGAQVDQDGNVQQISINGRVGLVNGQLVSDGDGNIRGTIGINVGGKTVGAGASVTITGDLNDPDQPVTVDLKGHVNAGPVRGSVHVHFDGRGNTSVKGNLGINKRAITGQFRRAGSDPVFVETGTDRMKFNHSAKASSWPKWQPGCAGVRCVGATGGATPARPKAGAFTCSGNGKTYRSNGQSAYRQTAPNMAGLRPAQQVPCRGVVLDFHRYDYAVTPPKVVGCVGQCGRGSGSGGASTGTTSGPKTPARPKAGAFTCSGNGKTYRSNGQSAYRQTAPNMAGLRPAQQVPCRGVVLDFHRYDYAVTPPKVVGCVGQCGRGSGGGSSGSISGTTGSGSSSGGGGWIPAEGTFICPSNSERYYSNGRNAYLHHTRGTPKRCPDVASTLRFDGKSG